LRALALLFDLDLCFFATTFRINRRVTPGVPANVPKPTSIPPPA
jgi:hypothetical protein